MEGLNNIGSIEKLLQTTGWSCDDLLIKLQQYKSNKAANTSEVKPDESSPSTSQQPQEEGTNVILDSYLTNCQKEDTLEESRKTDPVPTEEFTNIRSNKEKAHSIEDLGVEAEILNSSSNEVETSVVNVEKDNDLASVTRVSCEEKSHSLQSPNGETGSIDNIIITDIHSLEQQSTTDQEDKENTCAHKPTLVKDSFQRNSLNIENVKSILERNNDENITYNNEKNEPFVNRVSESSNCDETVHRKEIPTSSTNNISFVTVDDDSSSAVVSISVLGDDNEKITVGTPEISETSKVSENFNFDETVHEKEMPTSTSNNILAVTIDEVDSPLDSVSVSEKSTERTQEIATSSKVPETSNCDKKEILPSSINTISLATIDNSPIDSISEEVTESTQETLANSGSQEASGVGRLMIFKEKRSNTKITGLFLLKDPNVVDASENLDNLTDNSNSGANEAEASTSAHSELEPSSANEPDDLRNILKMQLSSLRNKKRSDLSGFQKKPSVLFENLKKKRKPVDVPDHPFAHLDKKDIESLDHNENEDTLISLSDETQFLIMNVTGGVNRVEDNPEGVFNSSRRFASVSNEASEDLIKTSDVDAAKSPETNFHQDVSVTDLKDDGELFQNEITPSNSKKVKITLRKKVIPFHPPVKKPMTSFLLNQATSGSSTPLGGDDEFGSDDDTKDPLDDVEAIKRSEVIENFLNKPNAPLVRKIKIRPFDPSNDSTHTTSETETDFPKPAKKKQDKSPFVSDSLEDFLTESAQLKISYAIPKLGAEEGLIEKTKKSPYDHVPQTSNKICPKEESTSEGHSGKKIVKAKTLAEKRRQFEKLHRKIEKHEAKIGKIKQHDPVKSRPHFTDDELEAIKDERDRMKFELSKKPYVSLQRDSYVLWNNRRLWLPARRKNKCLGNIKINRNELLQPKTRSEQKKLSLLSTLANNRKTVKVKYKAGPLSRKVYLQHSDSCRLWKTEIKTLPQVYLEVAPRINKPIDPQLLHLLPVFNDVEVSKERIDFALSVLKTNSEAKPFKFPLRYNNNQERLLVRKRHKSAVGVKLFNNDTNDPETCIKSILDDLITYVEIKETANSLIKEDDRLQEIDRVMEIVDKIKEKPNKGARFGKKRKLDLELQRLNCKVINVETEVPDDVDCSKLYCRMGCVCKSLACESVFSNHCQLVECMFECKCPPSRTEETLSEYTVNHLDDQAKRNLAKVEREFTQTIIHAGNDTIIVGSGGRNKSRRASKAPKKYSDYFEDILDEPLVIQSMKTHVNVKKCSVPLTKLNLEDVVPFCLTHLVHDCACRGSVSPRKELSRGLLKLPVKHSQSIESSTDVVKSRKPTELLGKSLISSVKPTGYKHSAAKVKQRKYSSSQTTEENVSDASGGSSARTRSIFPEYVERNKHPYYTKKLKKKYGVPILASRENTDLDVLDVKKSLEPLEEKRMNKRKQLFEIRQDLDGDKEPAIQRRKRAKPKCSLVPNLVPTASPPPASNEGVFDGEIQVPLRDNMDILKIIGEKNAHLDFFRILPWTKLVEGFNNGSILIWSMMGRPTALLCNKHGTPPPKNFVDIRKVNPRSEIINWIISNTLPPGRVPSLMYVILTPTKNHFLIMGFCLKNLNKVTPMTSPVKPVEPKSSQLVEPKSSQPVEPKTSQPSPVLIPPDKSLKCSHKDMNNEPKTLVLTNKTFPVRAYNEKSEDAEPRLVFHASLPRIDRSCKWRMIYLNSDFSYLCFVESKYSIKYTDLNDVVTMAKSMHRSINLRNNEFTQHYKHPIFGIFCVPEFQDRLFIGPFLKSEDHKIETLRYMQGSLINTALFNTIQNKTYVKKPTWIKESEITISNNSSPEILIDITQDDEDGGENAGENHETTDVKLEEENIPDETAKTVDDSNDSVIVLNDVDPLDNEEMRDTDGLEENLFCYPFVKELHSGELQTDKINRYVVTNIPHLGYLSAYQQDSKVIDVFWPDGSKGYRFPNTILATEALVQFFSQIFCPVPETFKINVVILTQLHVEKNCPINPKYFAKSKCYICGEFGVYSEDDCPVSMPSFRSLLRLRQRSDENIDRIVHLFGSYLMTGDELRKNPSTENILKWAMSEIYVVKRLGAHYESERKDLMQLTRLKLLQLKEVLKKFPQNERGKYVRNILEIKENCQKRRDLSVTVATLENIQNLKKREIVKKPVDKNPIATLSVMETIEIEDSDDEKRTETVKNSPPKPLFRPISKSGQVQVGGDERSLLKRHYVLAPGQSLLKVTEDPQFKLLQKESDSPIKISFSNPRNVPVNSKKAVLSQDKSLVKNVL